MGLRGCDAVADASAHLHGPCQAIRAMQAMARREALSRRKRLDLSARRALQASPPARQLLLAPATTQHLSHLPDVLCLERPPPAGARLRAPGVLQELRGRGEEDGLRARRGRRAGPIERPRGAETFPCHAGESRHPRLPGCCPVFVDPGSRRDDEVISVATTGRNQATGSLTCATRPPDTAVAVSAAAMARRAYSSPMEGRTGT